MKQSDVNWLADHGDELYEQYGGKWIAVFDGKIVGVGATATEAAEQARKSAPEGEYILEAIDPFGDVIYASF